MRFLLDTSSSFTWVPNNRCFGCKARPHFIRGLSDTWVEGDGKTIKLVYPQGYLFGSMGSDSLQLSDDSVFNARLMYVTQKETKAFAGYRSDGVIGLMPKAANMPILRQMKEEGLIEKEIFSLSLAGWNDAVGKSKIWFGGYSYHALRQFHGDKNLTNRALEGLIQWNPIAKDELYWAFEPT